MFFLDTYLVYVQTFELWLILNGMYTKFLFDLIILFSRSVICNYHPHSYKLWTVLMTSRGISYCCCVIIKNDTKTNMPKQTLNTQQIIVCTIIILFWILVLNYGKLNLCYQITYCLEDISLIWSETPGKRGFRISF